MTGINVGGNAVVAGSPLAFYVENDDGVGDWWDAWLIPAAGGSANVLSSNSPDTLYTSCFVSPDSQHICFIYNDNIITDRPYVMDIDGANVTQLSTLVCDSNPLRTPQWIDNTTIVFQTSTTRLRTVQVDGSGATIILTTTGLDSWQVAPDGSKIAFIVAAATDGELWVMDPDGSNQTQIATGLGVVSSTPLVWMADSSRIFFPNNPDLDSIKPDGTDQQTELTSFTSGFWTRYSMLSDRLMMVDTTNGSDWRLASYVFGTGYAILPTVVHVRLDLSAGVPYAHTGRVYTVVDGTNQGTGTDNVVSVLPDGSDLQTHFVPDQSGTPLFQNPGLL